MSKRPKECRLVVVENCLRIAENYMLVWILQTTEWILTAAWHLYCWEFVEYCLENHVKLYARMRWVWQSAKWILTQLLCKRSNMECTGSKPSKSHWQSFLCLVRHSDSRILEYRPSDPSACLLSCQRMDYPPPSKLNRSFAGSFKSLIPRFMWNCLAQRCPLPCAAACGSWEHFGDFFRTPWNWTLEGRFTNTYWILNKKV